MFLGQPVVTMLACFFVFTREAMGAHLAPGFPCALCAEDGRTCIARASRAARTRRRVSRHCEERQRRSNPVLPPLARTMDCFAGARNDEVGRGVLDTPPVRGMTASYRL